MVIVFPVHRASHEPTPAQIKAGNYQKRKVDWNGLVISIENESGSVRRGTNSYGKAWETRMLYPYGYIKSTMGVDGDHVDCFLGPNMDAPLVYVVHQRKHGDWSKYDEDKCMIGFDSEDEAKHAFLANYDDPRFLGPITTMSADEFRDKALATKDKPQMVKAVFFKAMVRAHTRRLSSGKVVNVGSYSDRRTKKPTDSSGQKRLFLTTSPMKDQDTHIDLYHGSPKDFDKFDSGKVGTGDGTEAKGHGVYLTDSRENAEWYRGKDGTGFLYKTRIPKKLVDTMIIWDKGLSKQPDVVKEAVEKSIASGVYDTEAVEIIRERDPIGKVLYVMLSDSIDEQSDAAKYLLSLGVGGITFPDSGRRRDISGANSYVVFDADQVAITHKNDKPANPQTS